MAFNRIKKKKIKYRKKNFFRSRFGICFDDISCRLEIYKYCSEDFLSCFQWESLPASNTANCSALMEKEIDFDWFSTWSSYFKLKLTTGNCISWRLFVVLTSYKFHWMSVVFVTEQRERNKQTRDRSIEERWREIYIEELMNEVFQLNDRNVHRRLWLNHWHVLWKEEKMMNNELMRDRITFRKTKLGKFIQ